MGILQFKDLTDWQDAALEEERAIAADPDDAGPIGARKPAPIEHRATWIRADPASGDLQYADEVPIEVYKGHDKLLPVVLREKIGIREMHGWLFQVRKSGPNPQPEAFDRLDGKEVMLSKLPHSRNYFVRRTLKPCKQEQGAAMWRRVARAWDNHPEIPFADERLDHALRELSVTPFVVHKGCRAAWAVVADRFPVLGEERFDTKDDYTIAALAMPFDEACGLLSVHPSIRNALDRTDSGRLFDRYLSPRDVLAAVTNKAKPPKGPLRRNVTQELFDNREELMKAACQAALCGREVPDAGDSVARGAVLLYHRFAYNFVDREKDPVIRPPQDQMDAGPGTSEPDFEGLEEYEMTREFTARYGELGFNRAAALLLQVIAHILQAGERAIDEDFVRTLRPALAGWPPGWKRPEGFEKALRQLNKPRS